MRASMKIFVCILPSAARQSRLSIHWNFDSSMSGDSGLFFSPMFWPLSLNSNLVISLSTPKQKSSDGPYMASMNWLGCFS